MVKRLFTLNFIDNNTKNSLIINNSVAPRLYGLPKIHKENCPLRPVVSCIGCPTYNIAKFVSRIINNISSTFSFNLLNSYTLVDKIKHVTLPVDYILISLDVKSLFTSIPKKLVLESIDNNWHLIDKHTNIDKTNFKLIIDFIFENSYFIYNEKCYKQIFGTAMGNPASPILANLVMNDILNKAVAKLHFDLPFLYCYVDDILMAVPRDKVDNILNCFNTIDNNIQFTLEVESNGRINYLDTTLIRCNDGRVLTDWFFKSNSSNRLLNYNSQHNLRYKRNVILELNNRIHKLSHPSFYSKNKKILYKLLTDNGYPEMFINVVLNNSKNREPNNEQRIKYFKIPYIQGLTESLTRILNTETSKIVSYNTKTVGNLFSKIKDKVPLKLRSNVVYEIPCKNCDCIYIGQTKQYISRRIQNHKQDCFSHNIIRPEKTALAAHHFDMQHDFAFDNVKILDIEENLKKRLFLEKIYITKKSNNINKKDDSSGGDLTVYKNLLQLPVYNGL